MFNFGSILPRPQVMKLLKQRPTPWKTGREGCPNHGILTEGGRLSTVDLLIKVACFVKNVNYIFQCEKEQFQTS